MALQKSYYKGPPRVDFVKSEFDNLIEQKGRTVLFEKSIQCPCKSDAVNQQANCKNCGGSGWLFINPKRIRMIAHSLDTKSTNYAPWSQEIIGTITFTCHEEHNPTFMDKLIFPDAEGVFNEVLDVQGLGDGTFFAFTTYAVKKVEYIARYISPTTALQRLVEGVDYSIDSNNKQLITFNSELLEDDQETITIRYVHPPTYHVLDMMRESMESFKYASGQEILMRLPVHGVARRAEYMIDRENYSGSRLIDNSYDDSGDNCDNEDNIVCQ